MLRKQVIVLLGFFLNLFSGNLASALPDPVAGGPIKIASVRLSGPMATELYDLLTDVQQKAGTKIYRSWGTDFNLSCTSPSQTDSDCTLENAPIQDKKIVLRGAAATDFSRKLNIEQLDQADDQVYWFHGNKGLEIVCYFKGPASPQCQIIANHPDTR